jgi:hypothetical protein
MIKKLLEVFGMKFVLRERLEKLLGEGIAGQIFPLGKYALVTEQTDARMRRKEAAKMQEKYHQMQLLYQNRTGPYDCI